MGSQLGVAFWDDDIYGTCLGDLAFTKLSSKTCVSSLKSPIKTLQASSGA